jgi:hypothetical protein
MDTNTNTISILVHIDQLAAIRAGVGGAQSTERMSVPLADLTPAQRDTLASGLTDSLDLTRTVYPETPRQWWVQVATMAELVRVLDTVSASRAERDRAEAEREVARAARIEAEQVERAARAATEAARIRAAEAARIEEDYTLYLLADGQIDSQVRGIDTRTVRVLRHVDGSSAAYKEEREAQIGAARAAYAVDAPAILAALAARAEAARAERDAWIAEHGSQRLRDLLALDLPVTALYDEERQAARAAQLAIDLPGWQYRDIPPQLLPPRNPSTEAIAALRAAREWDPAARLALRYRSYACGEHIDDDGDAVYDADCDDCTRTYGARVYAVRDGETVCSPFFVDWT